MRESLKGARWERSAVDERDVLRLGRTLDIAAPVARILLVRGYNEPAQARRFLNPSLADLIDPVEMYGMERAVARLEKALQRREHVRIVSDYDVDGTTASIILQSAFRVLGTGEQVSYHIPSRFDEGYGFSVAAAEQASRDGVSIVITCDIGVRDHAAVARAAELGVDVIICDHHLPPGEDVPAHAFAVLCPKQERCQYPNPELAACGLALKVAQALLARHPRRDGIVASLAKIAAIGTVADMVSLATNENRGIVAAGLAGLSRPSTNFGLNALLEVSGVLGRPVTAGDCGYRLGPRINAAGRLAAATTVLELFNAPNQDRARELAGELDRLNVERREVQARLVQRVAEALASGTGTTWAAVFAGSEAEGWHRGVVGIVATRIVEMVNRPAFVIAVDADGVGRGSARSVGGIHVVKALESCADILVKFGGHAAAAGFTIRSQHIEEFRERLSRFIESEAGSREKLARRFKVDATMTLDEFTVSTARNLQRLEPHGIGNPRPLFLFEDVVVRRIGVLKERHVKLTLDRGVEALWWDAAEHIRAIQPGAQLDLLGSCGLSEYQGTVRPQITIKDVRIGVR
jgi:single-stranded-DNA-specific exonuclease